ncbi:MAG TPA: dihydrofolate reductase [Stellaceae bacterium]
MMALVLVVALGTNRAIGRGGALPWHISEDLKRFRALTMGKPIVMGRKTFRSIGRALPGRLNIVVSRDPGALDLPDGVARAASLGEALEIARRHAAGPEAGGGSGSADVMVIGGGEIYRAALPLADRLEVTLVEDAPADADAFFPEWRESGEWRLVDAGPRREGDPAYSFATYERAVPRCDLDHSPVTAI